MQHLEPALKGNRVHIYPIGDVQTGALGFDEERFREHVEEGLADPYGVFIGLGDYTDALSPSNRGAIKRAKLEGNWYDTGDRILDEAVRREAEWFLSFFPRDMSQYETPLRNGKKWVCMVKGHHFMHYQIVNPDQSWTIRTSDHLIADRLGTVFTDDPSDDKQHAMISFKARNGNFIRVYARHGEGNGQSLSYPLTKLAQVPPYFPADVYLTGHYHKLINTKIPRMVEDFSRPTLLRARDMALVGCGSFLKAYMDNRVTYAEAGLMMPLAIGAPIIRAQAFSDGRTRIRVEA